MNLLKFYKGCMRTGRLPKDGLCHSLEIQERNLLSELLSPDKDGTFLHLMYWGYNGESQGVETTDERDYAFTPLRQTLVLLLNEIMKDLKKEKLINH